jgi:hypothetical protein
MTIISISIVAICSSEINIIVAMWTAEIRFLPFRLRPMKRIVLGEITERLECLDTSVSSRRGCSTKLVKSQSA